MGLISADILNECGIAPDSHVLVALSGGSDSVALFLSFLELQEENRVRKLTAAHFNHCLRGSESDGDLSFCEDLCRLHGVELRTASEDVSAYAKAEKIGIEEAARNCRYRFLCNVKAATDADCIALAHHADDQMETVLMHLIRGSGLKGLGGMQKRNGDFVRPFLGVTKKEILLYLERKGQTYRTDSSNSELCFERNRIRKELLPLLESLRPDMAKRVAVMTEGLQRDEACLQQLADNARKRAEAPGGELDCELLLSEPEPVRDRVFLNILREHLNFDFTGAQLGRLTELLRRPSGKFVPLKGTLAAWKDGKYLRIANRLQKESFQTDIRPGETVRMSGWTIRLEWENTYRKPESRLDAMFSADSLGTEPVLLLRQKEAGDMFQPLGMKKRKLVSDIYTDRKMRETLRKAPLLEQEGEILFVPGYTICEKLRITDGTKRILHIFYEEG